MNIWRIYRRSGLAIVLTVMALFAAMPVASAHESTSSVRVVPINGTVAGMTYGQWSEVWWQRALAVVTPDFSDCNPMNAAGGPVWFLAGTNVLPSPNGGTFQRDCTVPPGKRIMFPVVNAEWSIAEAQSISPTGACIPQVAVALTGTDYAALSSCAKAQVRLGNKLDADVDGQALNLDNQEAASPPPLFTFTTTAANPFGTCQSVNQCPLTTQAASDGIWIILKPLSAGAHTIHLHLALPVFAFEADVTYDLMVQ